jgi:hypothetical protein
VTEHVDTGSWTNAQVPARRHERGEKNARYAELGSLLADLSRGRNEPVVHVHDRTHVEFAIDYRLADKAGEEEFSWEIYFFAPESLRLDRRTYDKSDLYADLQSYVRFEVPDVEFSELADDPVDRIEKALAGREGCDSEAVMRELRLFACQVRAAGVETRKRIFDALDQPEPKRSLALEEAELMASESQRLTERLREVLKVAEEIPEPVCTAARWIDEDVSRLLETLLASMVERLRETKASEAVVDVVERAAIAEARYRLDNGIGGVGHVDMERREVEALEFRRHLLKRFTSSVLWLSPEVRPAATWVLQFLYAMAAGVAMAFAVAATIWNGLDVEARGWITWVLIAVLAYAVKDRIKAILQNVFSSVVERHFPDRRWVIRDRERGVMLGQMKEQSGFIKFKDLPGDVLAARRLTRLHVLEEQARPETVLYHRKQVEVYADRVKEADPRFAALTEIFRLDLRRWLAHTDDPKREIVFADPVRGRVDRAEAPRVYNIGVVYRLRRDGDDKAPWHRARVVVTRKGIRRIDPIT